VSFVWKVEEARGNAAPLRSAADVTALRSKLNAILASDEAAGVRASS